MRIIKYLSLLSLLLSACVKDKPKQGDGTLPGESGRKVFIANEGSLGNGNSSLAVYDTDKDSIYNNVFFQKNGKPLGDILQNLLIINDHLFLSVNNSDKIVVIDKNSFSLLAEINVKKPREMALVNDHKIYVSSLFHPEINIIDPGSFQLTGKITVDFPNTEGMVLLNGKVYACNWDTACNYIYEIDPETDRITNRINIPGRAPSHILADKDQKLWILAGNLYKGSRHTLTKVDPQTHAILQHYAFPKDADIIKPVFNPTKDTLYYLGVNYEGHTDHNGLFRMDIYAETLPSQLFIPSMPLQYYWGLGIDPLRNQIYLGDPRGFIQNGKVSVYDARGNLLKAFTTGLGPGFFYFD